MKTIFVPTDFSRYAENALLYAAALADTLQASLVIFHAYWVPLYEDQYKNDPEYQHLEALNKEKVKQTVGLADSNLNVLKSKVHEVYPGLEITLIINNGMPVDEILSHAMKYNADMIVMGTKGATGLKELVMGSNAADVIEHSRCPVLAIPLSVSWQGLKHIVFATNFQPNDPEDIAFLAEVAISFNARITILHADQAGGFWSAKENAFSSMKQFREKVENRVSYKAITFQVLSASDPLKGLEKFIGSNPVDIIAMATNKRSTLQKMLGNTSLTQKMAYHTHIPLLAFKA
jgi:nucleotide-binding universal stress UspA family protein